MFWKRGHETQQPKTKRICMIKVGNERLPASEEDIKEIAKQVEKAIGKETTGVFVTNHAIEVEYIDIPIENKTPAIEK